MLKMDQSNLTLNDFHYDLPDHLIAQAPSRDTKQNKLLIYDLGHAIRHSQIRKLINEIPDNALIIANDTKVIPGRIKGVFDTGGKFELMLLSPKLGNANCWNAMGKPIKKLKVGRKIILEESLTAEIVSLNEGATPTIDVRFDTATDDLFQWLSRHGYIPLPPYIKRPEEAQAPLSPDKDSYQTAFAKHEGSVAAPTAGLHFDRELIQQLEDKGVKFTTVTHHVGAGTFLPVKVDDISQHNMHTERYLISSDSHRIISEYKLQSKPIIAIGTTSFRCIESFYGNELMPDRWHSTDLFVYPAHRGQIYQPIIPDALMTNFHQPCSTLFMLISALIGLDEAKSIYQEAIDQKYRFFSYGDSSLLWLRDSSK